MRVHSFVFLNAFSVTVLSLSSSGAHAGTCTIDGTVYLCSGATDSATDTTVGISVDAPSLTVETQEGFGIDTSLNGGNAFSLKLSGSGATDLTFSDEHGSTIIGANHGIYTENFGTGALTIEASGAVTGTTQDGIYASNGVTGTDLSIMAAAVSGGSAGITATNNGSGALTIEASETVAGDAGFGIYADNYGTDLSIATAAVSGAVVGIVAQNFGSGALTVEATGSVTGTASSGLFAGNYSSGTDLSIDVADVSGSAGITTANLGSGALTIEASGTIEGRSNDGINAKNSGTDLSIAVDRVDGGAHGIYTVNSGSGALTITATGPVAGTRMDGISAENEKSATDLSIAVVDVSGGDHGIHAENYGSGALQVVSDGTVTGMDIGIRAKNSGTDLSITANAVNGGYYGMTAFNFGTGALSIEASGLITGSGEAAILASNEETGTDLTIKAATLSGYTDGINATNHGTGALTIETTGAVTGTTQDGIYAENTGNGTDLTITANAVSGGSSGIEASNDGAGALTIDATGTITGYGSEAIIAYNADTGTDLSISTADVNGAEAGIVAEHFGSGALTIEAKGTVTGTNDLGLFAVNNAGTDLSVSVVDVSGASHGLFAMNFGDGDLSIKATGTVEGTAYDGIQAINADDDTNLTITAATVSGGFNGIEAENGGSGLISISTTGAVDGIAGYGIFVATDIGDASLALAGTVSGGSGTAVDLTNVGGTSRVELRPGFGFSGIVDARNGNDGNRLVFGGPSGEALFDLSELDDGDDTEEAGEVYFGFDPVLLKEDGSTFILSGTNALALESGSVTGGVLALDDGSDLVLETAASLEVASGGALAGIGSARLSGSLDNAGWVLLSNGNGGFDPVSGLDGTDDVLTIGGDFAGGGSIALDSWLGDSTSPTDMLIIEGDVTGDAATSVYVSNAGGAGGVTVPNADIEIISVGGATDDADFVLGAPVEVGAYAYDLALVDSAWYLQSNHFAVSTYLYAGIADAAGGLGSELVGTLWERIGLREGEGSVDPDGRRYGFWLRGGGFDADGDRTLSSAYLTEQVGYDTTSWFTQGGLEVVIAETGSGYLAGSLFGHWANARTTASGDDPSLSGTLDLSGYGGGGSLTWYGDTGLYVDGVALATAYSSNLATPAGGEIGGPDGMGYAAGLEAGYAVALSQGVSLVPQGHLVYQSNRFDGFTGANDEDVQWNGGDSLTGRAGIAVKAESRVADSFAAQVYADANVLHQFLDPGSVSIDGDTVSVTGSRTSAQFGIGLNLTGLSEETAFTFYLDGDYTMPLENTGDRVISGGAGVRINW